MSGDPVCWLGQLCPECGAMPTDGSPDACWRCGTPRADGDPDDRSTPPGHPAGR